VSEVKETNMRHLDEMTLLLYIERQLDRARGLEVSAHTHECESCRTLLRALERESRLLTRAMLEEDEPLPSRLAAFQEKARRSMQWIWGLVFGLAATGVYALYTGYVQPWQQQLDQAGFGGTSLVSLLIVQGAFWKGWQSMITLLEVLALVTLAGLGAVFFRRRIRRGSALALVLAGFCGVLAAPAPAAATEFRKGQTVTVGTDEKIRGDIYASGERVRIEGTVDGDVIAAGKEIDIEGHVTGDVIVACQSLRIRGQVDGNIRAAGNNVMVTGSVAKNITWFGDSVTVDASGKVTGSVTMFGGTLTLDGHVDRDVLFFGDEVNVNNVVGGGIREKGHSLNISAAAQVGGPIRFEGDKPAEVSSQAKLASPVEFVQSKPKHNYRTAGYYIWQVIWAASFILFGLVLFALMPRFSADSVGTAEQYGASAGLGVLVMFGVPIAALIACVTVVGLFLGIATLLLWYASLYYAQVIVGALVGQWLLGKTQELWPLIGRMTIGVLLVRLCTTIPEVGGWVKLFVIIWGLGALSLALFRRFQPVIPMNGGVRPTTPLPPSTTVGGMQPA
jgi:cytoskeletal protein CcmA (bactofilin family)